MNLCLSGSGLFYSLRVGFQTFHHLPGRETSVRKLSCTPQLQRSKMGCYEEPVSDESPTNSYHPTPQLQTVPASSWLVQISMPRSPRSLLRSGSPVSLSDGLDRCAWLLLPSALVASLRHRSHSGSQTNKLHTRMGGSSCCFIFSMKAPGR